MKDTRPFYKKKTTIGITLSVIGIAIETFIPEAKLVGIFMSRVGALFGIYGAGSRASKALDK